MSGSVAPTPTILIANLPTKTLVGIDLLSFTSTPHFHGIKDLPAGAHFLYTGTTESFSLRSGEWFFVQNSHQVHAQDVRLRKWDGGVESIIPIDEGAEGGRQEAMRQRANLGRIWQAGGLLAYRLRPGSKDSSRANTEEEDDDDEEWDERGKQNAYSRRSEWNRLTEYISPSLLSRILGSPDIEPESRSRWVVTSGSSGAQDIDHIPGLEQTEVASVTREEERNLQFLPIDLKRTWREGAIGRERTEAAQDKSWAFGDLARRYADYPNDSADNVISAGEKQILGEMQFTFLMVLTLMNFSCLEQWKRLLGLILTCKTAVKVNESFFVKFIQLLKLQLKHCDDVEGGLFEMDGADGGSLLKKLLMGFRKTVDGFGNDVPNIRTEMDNLEAWVKSEYGWELKQESIVRRGMMEFEDGERVELEVSGTEADDETGEYAPVIVDIPGADGASGNPMPDISNQ